MQRCSLGCGGDKSWETTVLSTHCLWLQAQVDWQSLKEHVQETTQQETEAQQ